MHTVHAYTFRTIACPLAAPIEKNEELEVGVRDCRLGNYRNTFWGAGTVPMGGPSGIGSLAKHLPYLEQGPRTAHLRAELNAAVP